MGVLSSGFHRHASTVTGDGCSLCTLAHASVEATPDVILQAARIWQAGRAVAIVVLVPSGGFVSAPTPRGPPLG